MTIEAIEAEALKLNPSARATLARKLLHSLESLSEAEIEQLWATEALHRHDELVAGTVASRSAEDVLRDARARLL